MSLHSPARTDLTIRASDASTIVTQTTKVEHKGGCCTGKLTLQILLGVVALAAIAAVAVAIAGSAGAFSFTAIPLIGMSLATSQLTVVCMAVISLAVAVAAAAGLYATFKTRPDPREVEIKDLKNQVALLNTSLHNAPTEANKYHEQYRQQLNNANPLPLPLDTKNLIVNLENKVKELEVTLDQERTAHNESIADVSRLKNEKLLNLSSLGSTQTAHQ